MFHQNGALLGTLTGQLRQQEVFDRDRNQPETRALALLLHHAGLSCRSTCWAWTGRSPRAGPATLWKPGGLLKERIGQLRRWPANASRDEVEAWAQAFAWLFNRDPAASLT